MSYGPVPDAEQWRHFVERDHTLTALGPPDQFSIARR
jgi:hypothetical protein